MSNNLTGLTVSNTYGRLVQIVGGLYYDGFGNLLDLGGGTQGPTGSTGPQGATGAQGATGPQGLQGLQGVTGSTGPQGIQGATGPQGIQGVSGPQGVTGIGIQGPTGPQGATGPQGTLGNPGLENWYVNYGSTGVLYFDTNVRTYGSTQLSNNGSYWQNDTTETLSFNVATSVLWVGDGSQNENINTLYIYHSSLGAVQASSVAINVQSSLEDYYSTAVSTDIILEPGENFYIAGVSRYNGTNVTANFVDGRLDIVSLFVGEQGATGSQGIQGPIGPTGIGIQGPTGPVGPVGPQGIQGVSGPTGIGIQGATGPQGPTGSQGIQGPIGPTGIGIQGATGPQGVTGPSGGPVGPTGATGLQGIQGVTGPQGPTGISLPETISLYIDATPDTISTGKKAQKVIPFDSLISGWYIISEQVGNIEFDLKVMSFNSYPIGSSSIVGLDSPILINQDKNSNLNISWNINSGDIIEFYVTSNDIIKTVGLYLTLNKI
jgi:hypothetical protein